MKNTDTVIARKKCILYNLFPLTLSQVFWIRLYNDIPQLYRQKFAIYFHGYAAIAALKLYCMHQRTVIMSILYTFWHEIVKTIESKII